MPRIIQDLSYPTSDETHVPLQWKSGVVFVLILLTSHPTSANLPQFAFVSWCIKEK